MIRFRCVVVLAMIVGSANLPALAVGQGGRSGDGKARAPSAAPIARVDSLSDLMRAMRSLPGLEADYEEEKSLKLLAAPLRSSGRLYFMKPSHLRKDTLSPEPSTVLIDSDGLAMKRGSSVQHMSFGETPQVRVLVSSFVSLLAGDEAALEKVYKLSFHRKQSGWSVEMRPSSAPINQLISVVTIRGQGTSVRTIRVDETNGDYTVTSITRANPDRVFSSHEIKSLFSTSAL